MDNIFQDKPVFIPLVDDDTVLTMNKQPKKIVVEASTILWRKNTYHKLKKNFNSIIIDPGTGRIPHENARGKNYNKLPYAIKQEDVNNIYSDPTFRLEKLVMPCIDFQIDNDAAIVIAPYLNFEDTNSQNFVTNTSLITDTIRNMQSRKITKPLFATINFSSGLLANNLHLGRIIETYRSFEDHLNGFIIQIDNLDDRHAEEYTLECLAELIFNLSQNKEVIIQHIGGFAEILTLSGLSACIGGVTRRERFSLKDYDDPDQQRRGRGYGWTYVTELFNYRQDEDLEKIKYICNCNNCNGSLPQGAKETKKHFVTAKCNRMSSLQGLNQTELYNSLRNRLLEAQVFARKLHDAQIVFNGTYLSRWLSTIEKIKDFKTTEEEIDELNNLLKAIDQETNE